MKASYESLIEQASYCDLGDERLDNRLLRILLTFFTNPSCKSLPELFGDQHQLQSFYDFVNHPYISHELLLEGYLDGAVYTDDGSAGDVYYAIFDSVYCMYNKREKLDLGYVETESDNGMIIHNGLLLDEHFSPIGLLHQEMITRDRATFGKSEDRKKRPLEAKEFYKWIKGLKSAEAFTEMTDKKLIAVMDSEGDSVDIFNYASNLDGVDLVIRSSFNRKIEEVIEVDTNQMILLKEEEEAPSNSQHLWDYMRSLDKSAECERKLRNIKGKFYTTTCTIKHATFRLRKFKQKINVVYLKEIVGAEDVGRDPVEWLLFTSLPVENVGDAIRIVDTYTKRWIVEEYHSCMKTGCGILDRQFDSPEALGNVLAIISLVAVHLLMLRSKARNQPEESVTPLLEEDVYQMAEIAAENYLKPIDYTICKKGTVLWWVLLLGRIGGHQGYKQKGLPGWKTIWRGYNTFYQWVQSQRMFKRLDKT